MNTPPPPTKTLPELEAAFKAARAEMNAAYFAYHEAYAKRFAKSMQLPHERDLS